MIGALPALAVIAMCVAVFAFVVYEAITCVLNGELRQASRLDECTQAGRPHVRNRDPRGSHWPKGL